MRLRGVVLFVTVMCIASIMFAGFAAAVCTDSDDGVNTSVQGTTSGFDAYGGNLSVLLNYTDRCQNTGQVLEFFCNKNDGVEGVNVSCAYACDNGACSPFILSTNVSTNVSTNMSLNATPKSSVASSNASSVPAGDSSFPDPLAPESQDFFQEFTLEDFLTPERVASPQPELPVLPGAAPVETGVSEVIFKPDSEEVEFEPPVNRLLLNLTVNTSAAPPRLIGRGTFIDKSLLFPQFLPNVRSDAGLSATCDRVYQNMSVHNASLPRGSSAVLYLSTLSPSFKCPRAKNLDIEIAYRLVNVGIAEVYVDGTQHACRAPWYSPSLEQKGISVVRTPFVTQRVIVPPTTNNRVVRGSFVVPVREGSTTTFNHFYHASPRVVYLEAFRDNQGDYIAMELTLVRCAEGKGAPESMAEDTINVFEDIPEPSFSRRVWCTIVSWFGRDYESCLYG
jgi:hypothetical protein